MLPKPSIRDVNSRCVIARFYQMEAIVSISNNSDMKHLKSWNKCFNIRFITVCKPHMLNYTVERNSFYYQTCICFQRTEHSSMSTWRNRYNSSIVDLTKSLYFSLNCHNNMISQLAEAFSCPLLSTISKQANMIEKYATYVKI